MEQNLPTNGRRMETLEKTVARIDDKLDGVHLALVKIQAQLDTAGLPGSAKACGQHDEQLLSAWQAIDKLKASRWYISGAAATALVLLTFAAKHYLK